MFSRNLSLFLGLLLTPFYAFPQTTTQFSVNCLSAEDRESIKQQINEIRQQFDGKELIGQLKEASADVRTAQRKYEVCRADSFYYWTGGCPIRFKNDYESALEKYNLLNRQVRDNNALIREQIIQVRSMYPPCM